MSYPMFKGVSNPFPGTMADTSTPTPAGQMPQAPQQQYSSPIGPEDYGRFEAPAEQRPQAVTPNEQSQVNDLAASRFKIHQEIDYWTNAQYYDEPNLWKRLGKLALEPGIEPAHLALKRQEKITDLYRQDSILAEQQRILQTPSGAESASIKEFDDRERRKAEIFQLENLRRHMGLPPEDPSRLLQFYETGQAIRYPATGEGAAGDLSLNDKKDIVDLAHQVPATTAGRASIGLPPGSTGVPLVEQAQLQQRIKHDQDEADKVKEKQNAVFPVLGKWATPGELLAEMEKRTKQNLDDPGIEGVRPPLHSFEKYTVTNEFDQDVERSMRVSSPEQWKQAREMTAKESLFKGYEKYFPGYVDFPPSPAVEPKQGDVQPTPTKEAPPAEK